MWLTACCRWSLKQFNQSTDSRKLPTDSRSGTQRLYLNQCVAQNSQFTSHTTCLKCDSWNATVFCCGWWVNDLLLVFWDQMTLKLLFTKNENRDGKSDDYHLKSF